MLSFSPALAAQSPAAVETVMRHVDFHVDSTLTMQIEYLRGRLVARVAGQPASFDDKMSFEIRMDSASIGLSTTALSDLLNRYVFNYPGSPLSKLTSSTDSGRLRQTGHLHGIPFSILCDVSLTPAGELRLHPTSIHVLGIGAKGLMHTFGLSLQKLADVHKASGVRIEKDDLLLTPALLLPPPLTRGRLVSFAIRDSAMTLRFGGQPTAATLTLPDAHATNYMYFSGATIRFGKLTMTPTDLLVVDRDPHDWFDFWLARYQRQLVAGMSRTTPSGGLITEWPDFRSIVHRSPPSTPSTRP